MIFCTSRSAHSLSHILHCPRDNRYVQGERRSVDTCNKLGEFTITGVERARKGEPKVGWRACLVIRSHVGALSPW